MLNAEQQQLMMSKTFDLMYKIGTAVPCDVRNRDALKEGFTVCVEDLIDALDSNRITFERERDKNLVHGLLALAADFVLDGQLKNVFKNVAIN